MSAPATTGEQLAALLQAASRGDQAAYWRLLGSFLATLPWCWLIGSTLVCGLIGALLGHRHRRGWQGLGWGLLLGPLGWPLATRRRARPPPLPSKRI